MTQLTDKHWAVEVPQDKTCRPEDMTFANFYPHASKEVDEIIWIKCNGNSFTQKIIPGTWRFLFTTATATEEDARKVVAWFQIKEETRYRDYAETEPFRYRLKEYTESLASLLRSKGLDDKTNFAIIEKLSSDANN